jgi:hypothetical protein
MEVPVIALEVAVEVLVLHLQEVQVAMREELIQVLLELLVVAVVAVVQDKIEEPAVMVVTAVLVE